MKLETYFKDNRGAGILSTANKDGEVNSAIYARPHVFERDQIAFIMRDKLTHANLMENPSANYLFIEDGQGFHGVRLYLEKTDEVQDDEKIASLSRRRTGQADDGEKRFLVTFKVLKLLVLVGDEELSLE